MKNLNNNEMENSKWEDNVLISLKRQYKKDEIIGAFIKDNNRLRNKVAELENTIIANTQSAKKQITN